MKFEITLFIPQPPAYWELWVVTLTVSSEGAPPFIKDANYIRDQNLLFLRPLLQSKNSPVTSLLSQEETLFCITPLTWRHCRQVQFLLFTKIALFLNISYWLIYPAPSPVTCLGEFLGFCFSLYFADIAKLTQTSLG